MGFSLVGLLFAAGSILAAILILRNKKSPSLLFSVPIPSSLPKGRAPLAFLPQGLVFAALIFLALAMADPHLQEPLVVSPDVPQEGVALFLALDHSGSMQQLAGLGKTRLETLKEVAIEFVRNRPNDLIGALAFARGAEVLSPLTLDHEELLDKIRTLAPVKDPKEDGTAIGYALYKSASMLALTAEYASARGKPLKSKAVILVTDGIQDPNPLDQGRRLRNMGVMEAARFAAREGVRLYLIDVEPKVALQVFEKQRREMQEAAALAKGKLYIVGQGKDLSQILAEIDALEKSPLVSMRQFEKRVFSFYPYLIGAALFSLLFAAGLKAFFIRGVP